MNIFRVNNDGEEIVGKKSRKGNNCEINDFAKGDGILTFHSEIAN